MVRARLVMPVVAAAGSIVGAVQYEVARAGMRAAAKAEGLEGIGVGAEYALGWLVISLALLLVACAALRFRWWALAAIGLLAGELLLMGIMWRYSPVLGLHGDLRAVLFIPAAISTLVAARLVWQRPA